MPGPQSNHPLVVQCTSNQTHTGNRSVRSTTLFSGAHRIHVSGLQSNHTLVSSARVTNHPLVVQCTSNQTHTGNRSVRSTTLFSGAHRIHVSGLQSNHTLVSSARVTTQETNRIHVSGPRPQSNHTLLSSARPQSNHTGPRPQSNHTLLSSAQVTTQETNSHRKQSNKSVRSTTYCYRCTQETSNHTGNKTHTGNKVTKCQVHHSVIRCT